MKKSKIKKTKKLIKQLKPFWEDLQNKQKEFNKWVYSLEKVMEHRTGIKGVEFFMCDNEYVGIGNLERTMQLIQARELEK